MRFPRASGILLHPTSLPGPHGSGDFGPAAYHFVDWLAAAGQRLWQILPLGGLGPGNSPYMSSSAFAGNVLLIDLAELAERGWLDKADLIPGPGGSPRRLEYGRVVPWRMERLRAAAEAFASQGVGPAGGSGGHGQAASGRDRADYERFCAAEAGWLDDYALFMALEQHHGGVPWSEWPPELVHREPEALAAAATRHAEAIAFWKFCQWRFFEQWARLRSHAKDRGIEIVGDAPIFIAYQSAEVWARQALFELDAGGRPTVVAGVPPDYFSATGQHWGNPLYRWSAHAAEGYAWWVARIRHTFRTVDRVRIDHFRGFARYWAIPADAPTAISGRWEPGPGPALFEAIEAALGALPIIAEDLGIITPDVDELRRAFGFPGMRILHFAFGDDSRNRYLPHNHEPDSVVYTGTHDNDTTPGWWAAASEHERDAVRRYLGTDGREIHWDLIRVAMASVADTAIVPLQDVLDLATDHRMNMPGQSGGNWEWRFEWSQVEAWHAERLAAFARLYGRDGLPPSPPATY